MFRRQAYNETGRPIQGSSRRPHRQRGGVQSSVVTPEANVAAIVDDPRFRAFVEAFNQGRFFDAHEELEELWQRYSGPDRACIQGLIQAAVALEHHVRGNAAGARRVGARARDNLESWAPVHFGIDLSDLMERLRDTLERGTAAPAVRLAAGEPPSKAP